MKPINRRNFICLLLGIFVGGYSFKSFYSFLRGKKSGSGYSLPVASNAVNKIKKDNNHVIALRSESLLRWDGIAHPYVDYINQEEVDRVIDEGIKQLTKIERAEDAWRSLFNYKDGEKVIIKPNLNWVSTGFRMIVTSPHVVNSVVRALVEYVEVNEKNIYLYDVSRPMPSFYSERIKFDIRFVHRPVSLLGKGRRKLFGDLTSPSRKEILTSFPVKGENGESLKCYLPKVVASGDHLINIPILKTHQFLLFSGAMKNHFGSIVFSDNSTSPRPFHGDHIHDFIVDVNTNKHLQKIKRLVICDAIVGTWSDENLGEPEKWKTFGETYPSSLFFSTDSFGMDLYLRELVEKERKDRGLSIKPDTFLSYYKKRFT